MQSIKRNKDHNLGGSITICYIPVSLVDKDNFPLRDFNSLTLSAAITLLNDAKWLSIEALRESINNSDASSTSDPSLYNHSVSAFYASDLQGAATQFDKMQTQRFMVLRKDANGFWVLKGTPKEPLSFSYKKVTRDSVTGLKGFEFSFTGQCTKPELYYTADFETDDGNVNNTYLRSTVVLKNTGGTELITETISAGQNLEIIAPNAIATLNDNPFLELSSSSTANIGLLDELGNPVPHINVIGSDIIVTGVKIRRHAYHESISYCGKAPFGSAESENLWTITKITVNSDGTTATAVAINVNWTDYLTHTYT